jgi:hypothetical protein
MPPHPGANNAAKLPDMGQGSKSSVPGQPNRSTTLPEEAPITEPTNSNDQDRANHQRQAQKNHKNSLDKRSLPWHHINK